MGKIRTLVAYDDKDFKEEIINVLESIDGVEVVGTAEDGEETYNKIVSLKPEMVFAKFDLDKMDGLEIIKKSKENLETTPIFNIISDRILGNDLEEMIVRDKLTMLVVDQLSLMEDCTSKVGTPLRQQYANITLDLFDLSIRYDLPCLLLVQTNRQGALQQNGPSLENLAESDAIGQNATRVITMRNEGGIMTLQLVKNRYGSSDLIQRYEVDYGINKYKPVQEYVPEIESIKKAKAKAIFMNKQVNKF